jgi:Ca2+-dependent lipid-binding protein
MSSVSSQCTALLLFQDSHPANVTATGFPDPFAVATINGEQTRTTNVIKKTLNPYWNESFDL